MRALISRLLLGTGFCFAALQLSLALPSQPAARLQLAKGWAIRSSCETQSKGDAISAPVFHVEHWLATRVPSTVLAAQVSAGLFKDPFFGTNLLSIPGMDYPVGKIYANLPVTAGSPYRCSWWYRTEFDIPAVWKRSVWLHFNGINYRGNLWVNGKQVATDAQIRGAYRTYDFEITKYVQRGKRNAVAIETFIQTENDLGINYVDWNPAPADKSLGLWRDVYLEETGAVTLRNPTVNTHFADDQLSAAELTVIADVENHSDRALKAAVHGSIGAINFQQVVELAPAEKKIVRFRSEEFPQLRITRPPVWWPYQYGKPELQELKIAVTTGGSISDAKSIRFGIREVEGKLNDKGYLQFRINRRNILIRGAGWAPDMFYREPKERIAQEFRYVRDMNLNTIRLEGKLGSEDMFDLADQMGILIMAGWCCCDHWEHWENWTAADHEIANASLYSQISRLRAHPSVFVWLNGSDNPPPPDVESSYINILKERDWANPFISSASAKPSTLTGPSGVKMSGPYDYVPPEYWYLDKQKFGGAYGFNTETSPGPAIPSSADIRRTLPESSWWPMDDVWNYHAGLGSFAQYNIFNQAMDASFGPARSLDEYTRKAQLMSYDGERAMFEAYSGSKYTSTGVIQWMLNNAWPSFIWHLYDYYLVPGGGYFGAKKANELLHILYRYDDRTVAVVNSDLKSHDVLTASAQVFDLNGKLVFSQRAPVSVGPDAVVNLFSVPEHKGTHFLKLGLQDAMGRPLSENFYALPEKLSELDWPKTTYISTPALAYADYRDLEQMPKTTINATVGWQSASRGMVELVNRSQRIAFLLHAQWVKPSSDVEIAPVLWSDNYVSLLPGESHSLRFELPVGNHPGAELRVDGWNIEPLVLKSRPARGKGK